MLALWATGMQMCLCLLRTGSPNYVYKSFEMSFYHFTPFDFKSPQENERLKKEVYEQSNKVGEQNEKIATLLEKNQK